VARVGKITITVALLLGFSQLHAQGLVPASPQDIQEANRRKIFKIKPNKLAIERKNKELRAKGLPEIDVTLGAYSTDEVVTNSTTTETSPLTATASVVDNSKLPYFPPIGNQEGGNACAQFVATYYIMSHETCLARGCNNKTLGVSTIFSPAFTYNLVNLDNAGGGTRVEWGFGVHYDVGAISLASMPYSAGDFVKYNGSAADWRSAIRYRMNSYQTISGIDTSTGVANLKQLLANGHVAGIGTGTGGWIVRTVGVDPSAPSNPYAGQQIAVADTYGYNHAMTVVGYDDNIWTDINGNGVVETGEKGAFLLANSFGSVVNNNGFMWVSYDAIKASSTFRTDSGRIKAFENAMAYFEYAKPSYTPKLLAQFTLTHPVRSQMAVAIGTSATSSTSPTSLFVPYWPPPTSVCSICTTHALNYGGGDYDLMYPNYGASGTFVFDFTDMVQTNTTLKYYFRLSDNATGSPATLNDFRLTDASGNTLASYGSAVTADAGTSLINVNYTYVPGSDTTKPKAPGGLRAQ
jgi:hypothetical protein